MGAVLPLPIARTTATSLSKPFAPNKRPGAAMVGRFAVTGNTEFPRPTS